MPISQADRLSTKGNKGNVSLAIAAGGFLTIELLLQNNVLTGRGWAILSAGFEAGTIGGIADLFAVRALFHEIRIPYIRRHTNIIARNRERITEGIVDMVENNWLTPEAIGEKLAEFNPSAALLDYLGAAPHREQALHIAADVMKRLVAVAETGEFVSFLEHMIRSHMEVGDIARPIGRFLEKAILRRDHEKVWEQLLGSLDACLRDQELRTILVRLIEKTAQEFADENLLKKIIVRGGELFGVIDYNHIAELLTQRLHTAIIEAQDDPGHPVRVKLDGVLLSFASGLAAGDPAQLALFESLQEKLLPRAELSSWLHHLLTRFTGTLREQLDDRSSPFMALLGKLLDDNLALLRNDINLRDAVDHWVRTTVQDMVVRNHAVIGQIIRASLHPGRLPDNELIGQIEEKIGDDLEYIRLNGAIVGGLVGIVLAVLKLWL